MNPSTRQTREIRRLLTRTWLPFFFRFGKLLPVQIETIPRILEGDNVVVCSPTASGKTEAIVAPMCERILDLKQRLLGLVVLYITPTRALANDLKERLWAPLRDVGLSMALKTSDSPAFDPTSNLLITTPESFDSLMCRQHKALQNIRYVVLDELHLIDNTFRGDQTRILLERLREGNPDLRYYALSATLVDPTGVASRYFTPFKIVSVPGKREIDYELIDYSDSEEGLRHLSAMLRSKKVRKPLAFCDSRKNVELVSAGLKHHLGSMEVLTHHASLSKNTRLEAEHAMRVMKRACCVASPTLEIGIDIGDIDAIVLVGAPPSVSHLVQRLGRGNRRTERIQSFGLYRDKNEHNLFVSMYEAAREGNLESLPYVLSPSALVQQILSILFEKRQVPKEEMLRLLSPLGMPTSEIDAMLSNLRSRQLVLEARPGVYCPSQELMDLAEKGEVHSNIANLRETAIVDYSSGKEIGKAYVEPTKGSKFVFAGKTWVVVSADGTKIRAKPSEGSAPPPSFSYHFDSYHSDTGKFSCLVPDNIVEKYDSMRMP